SARSAGTSPASRRLPTSARLAWTESRHNAMTETQEQTTAEQRQRRVVLGTVVSVKMEKTIVVQVQRRFKHPRYRKYVSERVRYKAHDENNEAKTGDTVRIVSCRPLSRDKRWMLQAVVEKATLV